MLLSTTVDYVAGLFISNGWRGKIEPLIPDGTRSSRQKAALIISIATNLGLLFYFKYFNFFTDNAAVMLTTFGITDSFLHNAIRIFLPIGISFYTFQSMSYTIDVYRGKVAATRKFFNFAAFVTMFPQLVAGPIVRYKQIERELIKRTHSFEKFGAGAERFMIGLAKKVLIANNVAIAADAIFALPQNQLGTSVAWLGVIAYTLQIYFDFSAYSDMAIGLGLMLGFHFPENFLHPYASSSIKEFWRRWHVSLSTWFRDYLYIPLGGNRGSSMRTYLNLWLVFLLCGFWHGASWNFIIWGSFHGIFLIIERLGFNKKLLLVHKSVQHVYTLLVVMVGWVFFRSETLAGSMNVLSAMFGFSGTESNLRPVAEFLTVPVAIAMVTGIIAATGIPAKWAGVLRLKADSGSLSLAPAVIVNIGRLAFISFCMILSLIFLTSGSHNPFIYFRF